MYNLFIAGQTERRPMNKRATSALVTSILAGCSASAWAQSAATFELLEVPPGFGSADGLAISGDGTTIAGVASSPTRVWWRRAGVTTVVTTTIDPQYGIGISRDGGVMCWAPANSFSDPSRMYFTASNSFQSFPQLGGLIPHFVAVSGDGTVFAGNGVVLSHDSHVAAWSAAMGHVQYPLINNQGYALAVSDDGRFAVGAGREFASGTGQAIKWELPGTPTNLGALGPIVPNQANSGATGVSSDGAVIVGWSGPAPARPVRWTASGIEDLGLLPGLFVSTRARVVSGNGVRIVGDVDSPGIQAAFIWDRTGTPRDLRGELLSQGAQGGLESSAILTARAITLDGGTVVGTAMTAGGVRQAYIARFGTCAVNCDLSTSPPVLNTLDFACFLNHFAAGHPYANCDQSSGSPALNALDFSCFLTKFSSGCP